MQINPNKFNTQSRLNNPNKNDKSPNFGCLECLAAQNCLVDGGLGPMTSKVVVRVSKEILESAYYPKFCKNWNKAEKIEGLVNPLFQYAVPLRKKLTDIAEFTDGLIPEDHLKEVLKPILLGETHSK